MTARNIRNPRWLGSDNPAFFRPEPNLHLLVENVGGCSELTLVLLDLLAQYELHMGSERLCAKIVGTILNVFLKLVSTGEATNFV